MWPQTQERRVWPQAEDCWQPLGVRRDKEGILPATRLQTGRPCDQLGLDVRLPEMRETTCCRQSLGLWGLAAGMTQPVALPASLPLSRWLSSTWNPPSVSCVW